MTRAVSTAYYSVFHLLIATATRRIRTPDNAMRNEVARWFDHKQMKQVCTLFSTDAHNRQKNVSGNEATIARILGYHAQPPSRVPPELSELADIFNALQQERHSADYDLGYQPKLQDTRNFVASASRAHELVSGLKGDPVFEFFCLLLLSGVATARNR